MTGNGVTAEAVNERIDKMGQVYLETDKRIKQLERAYMTHIQANMEEYKAQTVEMDELQKSISAGPIVKRECAVELAELRDKISAVEGQLADIEAGLYLNVCSELDDDNKLVYTNESSRKAALRLAMRHSDEYQDIKGHLDKLNMDKARLEAQLQEIEDTDKRSMALFRGCVARIENITARISL